MTSALHVDVRLEDDALWATVREFPGVFATGDTLDELRTSLADGIALYLAKPGEEPAPLVVTNLASGLVELSASAQLQLT